MYTNNKLSKAIKLAIVFGAVSGASISTVSAQEESEVTKVERIEITGSRLRSTDLQGFTPVQVINAADIDQSGVVNIQELLTQNPAFGAPAYNRTNSNFLTSNSGVASIDLRNLGTSRTLVLINGRRHVSGVPGSMAVDLNSIPTQFIERVEVMTGGASAVYGSDAVAGVVNFILKKEFTGAEFSAQYGESSEGDSEERKLQLTLGSSTADGKGNAMLHVAYTDQGAVYTKDRARSAMDQYSTGVLTGDPSKFFEITQPYLSSYAPQGWFTAGNTRFTYDKQGNLKNSFDTNVDGYNRSDARTIAVPTERFLLAGNANYEFKPGWNAFLEATYASSQTKSEMEPFALGATDIYADGQVPIEFASYAEDPNNPGQYIQTIARNPIVPIEIYNAAIDTNGDGLKDIGFGRRMTDIANRGNIADRDTFRFVVGVDGELSDSWFLDAYIGYGHTKVAQVSQGQVNVLNFRNALEVITDANGNAICRDATARDQGCVPVNIFGENTLSKEAVDYVNAPGMLTAYIEQKYAGFNLSGDLFELPAGAVGLATGVEYREEYSRNEFDALQQAGLNAGNKIPRTEGEFDVTDVYAEVNVPLLADVSFAKQLNLRSAVRLSDYSTVGSATSWNVSLDWAPVDELRFRLIRAQSTRAPNITELYAPPSQTFPTVTDPCIGVTATSSGAKDDACRAAPGVLANIQANGAFTLNQSDTQGVSGYNRGNPNLDVEKGKSWTFGLTFSPENIAVLEDFDFNIDYFKIEIEDAIVSTSRSYILTQCYGGDASFCNFITRRPAAIGPNSAGSLEFVDSGVTNSGGLGTEGLDFVVSYSKNLEDYGLVGRLKGKLTYTHLIDGYTIPLVGASSKDQWDGEIGAAKDKFTLNLGYSIGDWDILLTSNFIGQSYFDDAWLSNYSLPAESYGVGSVTYHNLNVSYTAFDNVEIYAGAQNLFDKEPPLLITGLPGGNTGVETDASTYDAIGRRLYAGVKVKF